MGVLLILPFLVKRLEYDRYFIEKSVPRLLKIQYSEYTRHTRTHLHKAPFYGLIHLKGAVQHNLHHTTVPNIDIHQKLCQCLYGPMDMIVLIVQFSISR